MGMPLRSGICSYSLNGSCHFGTEQKGPKGRTRESRASLVVGGITSN